MEKNIFKTIKLLNDNNYRVVIITNQAGIAKGYFSLKKFLKYRDWFHNEFLLRGLLLMRLISVLFILKVSLKSLKGNQI